MKPTTCFGQHLNSLQYLRGIAALAVVYFHAVIQVGHIAGVRDLPMTGAFGVDIFFVLSGFVMWWTTSDREVRVGDFLLKRLIRIAPLYWVLTLAASSVALFFGNLLRSTKFDAVHVAFSLLFLPYWNPAVGVDHPEALSPVIVPGWTLNAEMMFYVVFALALLARQPRRPWIVALLLAGLYVSARTWLAATPARFYGTDLLAEFLAGICLAYYLKRIPRAAPALWTAAALLAFALLCWFDFSKPPVLRAIALGIPALVLVCSALQIEVQGRLPRLVTLARLGDASYSIYLSHIFVVAGSRIAAERLGIDVGFLGGIVFVVFVLVASSGVGWIVHRAIELPLLGWANAMVRKGRARPAAAEFGS